MEDNQLISKATQIQLRAAGCDHEFRRRPSQIKPGTYSGECIFCGTMIPHEEMVIHEQRQTAVALAFARG